MSKSATLALKLAYDRGDQVYGETLVAAIATDGISAKHECFQHAAGHLLSPPLRPDPTTPQFLLMSLAQ